MSRAIGLKKQDSSTLRTLNLLYSSALKASLGCSLKPLKVFSEYGRGALVSRGVLKVMLRQSARAPSALRVGSQGCRV